MQTQIYVYNSRSTKPDIFSRMIMVGINRRYHHSLTRIIDDTGDWIYESSKGGYKKVEYTEWIKTHINVLECNANKRFNLTEEQARGIKARAEGMLGQDIGYGYWSILGIVVWFFIKAKTFGVDENANLICSEVNYVLFKEYIGEIERPQDYVTPRTTEKWFFN